MPSVFVAGASAATSIVNGALGANAEGEATGAAKTATNQNNALAGQVYATNQDNAQPFVNAGQNATAEEEGLLGIGGDAAGSQQAFQKYLGSNQYQFQFGQGTAAVNTADAADFNSGANEKALTQYGQGVAGSALAGYENQLGGLSSLGANQATALANTGTNYVNQVSSNNNNLASVEGGAAIGTANQEENALNGVLGAGTSAYTASNLGAAPSAFAGQNFTAGPASSAFSGVSPSAFLTSGGGALPVPSSSIQDLSTAAGAY